MADHRKSFYGVEMIGIDLAIQQSLMGIELHTKFRIVHATLSLLCIIILGVLGTTFNDSDNLRRSELGLSLRTFIFSQILKVKVAKGTNNLPDDNSLPWSFITPLTLLIIGFLISLAFCIVRIVIRVNFPVVGFAAHALAAICYFTASVILIYSLTVDEENPLFQPKDRFHPSGSCDSFNMMSQHCQDNMDSCKEFIDYCSKKAIAEKDGRSLEPDLSPKSMVIVDVVVSFGCVFMALFGSYFAYEDYQESEYDEGDVDSAVSTDPRRYAPGNHEASTSNGKMSSTLNGHYKLNGQRVVKAGLDHQPKLELNS